MDSKFARTGFFTKRSELRLHPVQRLAEKAARFLGQCGAALMNFRAECAERTPAFGKLRRVLKRHLYKGLKPGPRREFIESLSEGPEFLQPVLNNSLPDLVLGLEII